MRQNAQQAPPIRPRLAARRPPVATVEQLAPARPDRRLK
jgi:hypothetical protein